MGGTFTRKPVVDYAYRADPSVPAFDDSQPLVLFDGFCGLCSKAVQFTLKHDRTGRHRFAAAQSPLGDALYRHLGLDTTSYDSFVLLKDGHAFLASDGALELVAGFGGVWRLAILGKIVPRPLRDLAYGLIARNRMRFFGRRDACLLPAPDQAGRFLDRPT